MISSTISRFLVICLIGCVLLPFSGLGDSGWRTDYEAARLAAIEREVPLVVFFTGSDWCVWCSKLEAELFSSSEFREAMGTRLIGLKVDFPRRKRLPVELARQNRLLKERFEVEAYPTVIWLNPVNGRILRRHGYVTD